MIFVLVISEAANVAKICVNPTLDYLKTMFCFISFSDFVFFFPFSLLITIDFMVNNSITISKYNKIIMYKILL